MRTLLVRSKVRNDLLLEEIILLEGWAKLQLATNFYQKMWVKDINIELKVNYRMNSTPSDRE